MIIVSCPSKKTNHHYIKCDINSTLINFNLMKHLFILLSTFITYQIHGQVQLDSSLIKTFKTNYAVPDQPGFLLLGGQPSKIFRNSKILPLSLITEFFDGTRLTLPKSLGVEIAPYQLIQMNQSFQNYNKNYILNHTAISLGTIKDSNGISNIAIGLKMTLLDKTDPNRDPVYTKKVIAKLRQDVKNRERLINEYMEKNGITDPFELGNEMHNKKLKTYLAEKMSDLQEIKKMSEEYQNEHWNKLKIDLAVGALNSTHNGSLDSLQFSKFGTWLTMSSPLLKNSQSQNVLGIHYGFIQNDAIHTLSISDRVYFGSNKLKGFIEGQANYNTRYNGLGYLTNLGGEYNILGSIWLDFSFGIYKDLETGNTGRFNSVFHLRYSMF